MFSYVIFYFILNLYKYNGEENFIPKMDYIFNL